MNKVAIGSVAEVESEEYREFMGNLNEFAEGLGLRTFVNWSKNWEYPWLWMHGLNNRKGCDLLDIGSELSPMPWFMEIDRNITMVEHESMRPTVEPVWRRIREIYPLDWTFVSDEGLPFPDESFDTVTSFSVIEHQSNKEFAISEAVRVLRPGGMLAISFDLFEVGHGMVYPHEYGHALTMEEFETLIWYRHGWREASMIKWNTEDIPGFLAWHKEGNPKHNYVCGAAVLEKL